MTYANAEESPETGSPITLYEFRLGERDVDVLRFTDSDNELTYQQNLYSKEAISRTEIQMDGSLNKHKVTISLPAQNEIAKIFRFYPPSFVMTVQVHEGHWLDEDRQFLPIMTCRVLSCETTGVESKLTCEPSSTSLKHMGLRRNYQRQCPLVLYGGLCRATKSEISRAVTNITGNVISIADASAIEAVQCSGGIAQWVNSDTGRTELRTILSASKIGSVMDMTLAGPITGNPTQVVIVKGCAHTEQSCQDWHDNIVNFGGQPWIPLKSPFGTISEFF